MNEKSQEAPLSLALPKGRLLDEIQERFAERGMAFSFENENLWPATKAERLRSFW